MESSCHLTFQEQKSSAQMIGQMASVGIIVVKMAYFRMAQAGTVAVNMAYFLGTYTEMLMLEFSNTYIRW